MTSISINVIGRIEAEKLDIPGKYHTSLGFVDSWY
jgi:hypothetical protein